MENTRQNRIMTIRRVKPVHAAVPRRERVAAYCRVSTGKEAMLHSLAEQVSYYSAYIQKHPGWAFAGVYADEAYTGTKVCPKYADSAGNGTGTEGTRRGGVL